MKRSNRGQIEERQKQERVGRVLMQFKITAHLEERERLERREE